MYTIIGYDKDGGVFVEYGNGIVLEDVIEKAKKLAEEVKKDELRRENGEPIDWIEVYWNYNKEDEERVWASYEQ